MRTFIRTFAYLYTFTHSYACIYAHLCTFIHIFIHSYAYIYTYLCTFMHIYTYIYIFGRFLRRMFVGCADLFIIYHLSFIICYNLSFIAYLSFVATFIIINHLLLCGTTGSRCGFCTECKAESAGRFSPLLPLFACILIKK